jgi:hypothetical protein
MTIDPLLDTTVVSDSKCSFLNLLDSMRELSSIPQQSFMDLLAALSPSD